jgi:hypothetical protein
VEVAIEFAEFPGERLESSRIGLPEESGDEPMPSLHDDASVR